MKDAEHKTEIMTKGFDCFCSTGVLVWKF